MILQEIIVIVYDGFECFKYSFNWHKHNKINYQGLIFWNLRIVMKTFIVIFIEIDLVLFTLQIAALNNLNILIFFFEFSSILHIAGYQRQNLILFTILHDCLAFYLFSKVEIIIHFFCIIPSINLSKNDTNIRGTKN